MIPRGQRRCYPSWMLWPAGRGRGGCVSTPAGQRGQPSPHCTALASRPRRQACSHPRRPTPPNRPLTALLWPAAQEDMHYQLTPAGQRRQAAAHRCCGRVQVGPPGCGGGLQRLGGGGGAGRARRGAGLLRAALCVGPGHGGALAGCDLNFVISNLCEVAESCKRERERGVRPKQPAMNCQYSGIGGQRDCMLRPR